MKKIFFSCLVFLATVPSLAQYKLYDDGLKKYNAKDYYGAIELLSDFLTRQIRDKKFDADAYYWRGMAAFKLNDFSDALDDLKQSVALNHSNKGNIHWFMAKCHENLGQFNHAVAEYGNALNVLGKDKQTQYKLLADRSKAHAKAGNTQAAVQDLQAALAIQPSDYELKKSLADLTGKPVETVTLSKKSESQKSEPQKSEPQKSEPTQEVTKSPDPPKSDIVSERLRMGEQVKTEPAKTESASRPETQPVVVQQNTPPVVESREPTLDELYKDEKRYALVIGNSAYPKQIGVLKNPVNDATDFSEALRAMNFDVTLVTDASYGKIRVEMMKFREKLNKSERDQTVGLFYYAGHGLQYENENYIIPVDAEIQYEDDIPRFCFPIQKMVLTQMEMTNSRMNIVILDACRNNPYPALHRSIGEQSGLGEMKKARGAYIAYATAPGSVASDGTGRNGLYTQELIKAMSKPGRTIEQVFKEVRANVLRQSGEKQNPWENSNIIGDFYFKLK